MSEGGVDRLCDENDGCGNVCGVRGDLGWLSSERRRISVWVEGEVEADQEAEGS